MLARLIAKYGLPPLIAAVLFLILALRFAVWPSVKAWYYESKVEHVTAQRDTARAAAKVARADEKQAVKAAAIASDTVAAQDTHASTEHAETTKRSALIDERIKSNPTTVPLVADPVVYAQVREADDRARAALDRLRGTPRP